jgi:copper ion binding protein
MESVNLKVDGMSCGHCSTAVNNAVSNIDGTVDVSVDLKNGLVSFKYDQAKAQLEAIKAAITEEGFTVSP